LPQASDLAGQNLSHPQQIRCGFFGERGNFLATLSPSLLVRRQRIKPLPLDAGDG
jgi:hypothetical protein